MPKTFIEEQLDLRNAGEKEIFSSVVGRIKERISTVISRVDHKEASIIISPEERLAIIYNGEFRESFLEQMNTELGISAQQISFKPQQSRFDDEEIRVQLD